MRMRFKPYAGPELAACDFHVNRPVQLRGQWHAAFARRQPLHIEMGCGKGGFMAQLAVRNPQINYVGIDITDKVLILAKRKIEAQYAQQGLTPDNVKILTHNIEHIDEMLCADDAVSRIYINFCNPWNLKSGHKKHRLTHPRQLVKYRDFLTEDGEIYFKCDNDDLFEDSVGYFTEAGFEITYLTRDLHAQEPEWNIRTEHEAMFSAQGIPIKALIARKAFLAADYVPPRN